MTTYATYEGSEVFKLSSFDKEKLDRFWKYLDQVWQNRSLVFETDEEGSAGAKSQQFLSLKSQDGKVAAFAKNYVGVIQFEGDRIEILPKIFRETEITEKLKKQCWINVLYWFTYCRKIKFPFNQAQVSKIDLDEILEILISLFSSFTLEVLQKQPYQAYQRVTEETPFLKGRLSIEDYINNNLITGKWQNFYCSYEPFIYDNQFNRIVKFVSKRLSFISENTTNKNRLNDILFLLSDVSDVACSAADCEKVNFSSFFEDHRDVLDFCRLFLSNEVLQFQENDTSNFCFLLPMEYIFEDFAFGFLSTHFPAFNFASQSTSYLAKNISVSSEKDVFQIKNDIYSKDRLIIDTKYKIRQLSSNDGKDGIDQKDLYQMISYSLVRKCKNVLLLYPDSHRDNVEVSKVTNLSVSSDWLNDPIKIKAANVKITFDDIRTADSKLKGEFSKVLEGY